MLAELKCDFNRYVYDCGFNKDINLFRKLYILFKNPIFFSILIYRLGYMIDKRSANKKLYFVWIIPNLIYMILQYLSVVIFKVQIQEKSEIAPGLFLANKGNIIIGAEKIGKNCTINYNVTIGMDIGINSNQLTPLLGDNVNIGADSLIYGGIKIGSNTIIESYTVLSKDVPGGCIVRGNPARIFK